MDRAAIFIDGGYLDKLLANSFNHTSIDYEKLSKKVGDGCDVLRTYYYHCPAYQDNPPTNDQRQRVANQQRFFSALSRLSRFQIQLGKLARRGIDANGNPIFVQKRVDIMLGVDMVQLAATRQINRAILIAGDSDFLPAITAVKPHGVLVALFHGPKGYGVNSTVHQELWDSCDERTEMTQKFINSVKRK